MTTQASNQEQQGATFELVHEETKAFGRNAYLEVARKRMVDGVEVTEFILLTRGYMDEGGKKRWTKFVTIPDEAGVREWLVEALAKV